LLLAGHRLDRTGKTRGELRPPLIAEPLLKSIRIVSRDDVSDRPRVIGLDNPGKIRMPFGIGHREQQPPELVVAQDPRCVSAGSRVPLADLEQCRAVARAIRADGRHRSVSASGRGGEFCAHTSMTLPTISVTPAPTSIPPIVS